MPTPRYVSRVRATPSSRSAPRQNTQDARSDFITQELVERPNASDSRYYIRGVLTPTRIPMQLKGGDLVHVQWRDGSPFMILEVLSRRGPGTDEVFVGGGIEELICAPAVASEGGPFPNTDVWFRNESVITNLDCAAKAELTSISNVRWGAQRRHFVVWDSLQPTPVNPGGTGSFDGNGGGHAKFYVFKLSGSPTTAIRSAPKATLISTIDAATLGGIALGTVSIVFSPPPSGGMPFTETAITLGGVLTGGYVVVGSGTLVESIRGQVKHVSLNKRNEVILTADIFLIPKFGDLSFTFCTFVYPVIVNLTTGAVLYNGLAERFGSAPAPPLYDGINFEMNPSITGTAGYRATYDLTPLFNEDGDLVNGFLYAVYTQPFGGLTSTVTMLYPGAAQATTPPALPVTAQMVSLHDITSSVDKSVFISSNERYVMWRRETAPTITEPVTTDARITQFALARLGDTPASASVVSGPTAVIQSFFLYGPVVLLAPSLLLALNMTSPAPTSFSTATLDVKTSFVKFLTGRVVTLLNVPVKMSTPSAKLKDYAKVPAAAHIPQFIADRLTYPVTNRNEVTLGNLLGFSSRQTVGLPGS
jgi:hypothetical protein